MNTSKNISISINININTNISMIMIMTILINNRKKKNMFMDKIASMVIIIVDRFNLKTEKIP